MADHFVTQTGGLYVWPRFIRHIIPAYPDKLVPRGLGGVKKFMDLPGNMLDSEIIAAMGGEEEVRKYAFTPDQADDLIKAQPGGATGLMLTNGMSTIIYMIGVDGALFGVHFLWDSHYRKWRLGAHKPDEHGYWLVGHRFLRNTRIFEA